MSGVLGWWWRYEDGNYPTSTQLRIDGAIYRFNARGYMVTGWVYEDGQWYYYGASGGQSAGWVRVHGTWYYLDPLTGAMASGWPRCEAPVLPLLLRRDAHRLGEGRVLLVLPVC